LRTIQPPAPKLRVVISYPKRFISNLSSSLVRGGVSLIAIGESHLEASALVLVDMAPQMEAEGARRIQAFMNQKPEGFDTLQEVADAIANYQPHRPRPRLLDGLAKNVRLGADGKYHALGSRPASLLE
jgi:hypothetical protein